MGGNLFLFSYLGGNLVLSTAAGDVLASGDWSNFLGTVRFSFSTV